MALCVVWRRTLGDGASIVDDTSRGRIQRKAAGRPPKQWAQTRSQVDVLRYWDHSLNAQFTDRELRVWFFGLRKLGLKLGLGVGAVKLWARTGSKTFEIEHVLWDRFRALGGDVK